MSADGECEFTRIASGTSELAEDLDRALGRATIPVRDVPATILNLMGLDDDQLRYLHSGRLRQLTDIGGSVLDGIIHQTPTS